MDQFELMEVKVSFKSPFYYATSTLFSKCEGKGKTESEALHNLATSLSKNIHSILVDYFKDTLISNNYTNIILDTKKESNEHTRMYKLFNELPEIHRSMLMKLKLIENGNNEFDILNLLKKTASKDQLNVQNSPLNSFKLGFSEKHSNELSNKSDNDQESFVFGFPLSFN